MVTKSILGFGDPILIYCDLRYKARLSEEGFGLGHYRDVPLVMGRVSHAR